MSRMPETYELFDVKVDSVDEEFFAYGPTTGVSQYDLPTECHKFSRIDALVAHTKASRGPWPQDTIRAWNVGWCPRASEIKQRDPSRLAVQRRWSTFGARTKVVQALASLVAAPFLKLLRKARLHSGIHLHSAIICSSRICNRHTI